MNAAHAALRWLQHGSLRLRLLLGTLVWLVLAVAGLSVSVMTLRLMQLWIPA